LPVLNTPIVLSVFNRPDTTERVFQAIARAQPRQLFVFADGPRTREEAALCEQARRVTEQVDWNCEVSYDFSAVNVGARRRYSSGVDWAFSHVDEAIVLDDDCLPDDTFFPFCEAMLERYRDDPRVMMVCGTNYLERWKAEHQSYHFSYFGSVWGWATWKRAWRFYDVDMAAWGDAEVRERIRVMLDDERIFEVQERRFERLHRDKSDRHSWDLPWSLARLAQGGLTLVPALNLVTNLGNAEGRGLPPEHPLARTAVAPLEPPYRPPDAVAVDREYDRLHVRRIFEWWEIQAAKQAEARRRSQAIHRRFLRGLRRASSPMRSEKSSVRQ
jgi:hypothetical protein